MDHSLKDQPIVLQETPTLQNDLLLVLIPIVIAIIVGIFFAIRKKAQTSKIDDKTH